VAEWIDAFGDDLDEHWQWLGDALKVKDDCPAPRPSRAGKKDRFGNWWSSWSGRAVRVIFYTMLGMFLAWFDPLGMAADSDRFSQVLFYKFIALGYGEGVLGWPDGGTGIRWNQHTTVLLLDDSALDVLDQKLPISHAAHADILEDLYETYRPAIIPVDILFIDRWPGEEADLTRLHDLFAKTKKEDRTEVFPASDGRDIQSSPPTAFARLGEGAGPRGSEGAGPGGAGHRQAAA